VSCSESVGERVAGWRAESQQTERCADKLDGHGKTHKTMHSTHTRLAALAASVLAVIWVLIPLHTTHPAPHDDMPQLDPSGYVMTCLCMGRFGNQVCFVQEPLWRSLIALQQADHLLGTLEFARRVNRTLVLTPFLGYEDHRTLELIPFSSLFNITYATTILQRYSELIHFNL
jgi:hypothetical protein